MRTFFLPDQGKAGVLTIAHRGARSMAPENTLKAIQKAHEVGADMCEVDVRLTEPGADATLVSGTLKWAWVPEERLSDDDA